MGALTRHVALLRGVNVGKGNRVPMAAWRELIAGMGGHGVRTLLNSGNAVFDMAERDPDTVARRMRAAIAESLGLDLLVVVKTAAQWRAICAANPLVDDDFDPARVLVAMAPDAPALAALAPLRSQVGDGERFHIGEHAAYLACAGGLLGSRVAGALLGKAGRGVTTRNWATMLKIDALLV